MWASVLIEYTLNMGNHGWQYVAGMVRLRKALTEAVKCQHIFGFAKFYYKKMISNKGFLAIGNNISGKFLSIFLLHEY